MKGDTTSLIHSWQPWRRPPIFLEVAVSVSSPWGQTVQTLSDSAENDWTIGYSKIYHSLQVECSLIDYVHSKTIHLHHSMPASFPVTHTPSINLLMVSSFPPAVLYCMCPIYPLSILYTYLNHSKPYVTNAVPQLKLPWYSCAHKFTYPFWVHYNVNYNDSENTKLTQIKSLHTPSSSYHVFVVIMISKE